MSTSAYEEFFNRLPIFAMVASKDANIVYVNDFWVDVLGWEKGEMIGKKFLDFVHPDDIGKTVAIMGRMESNKASGFKNRYKCKNIRPANIGSLLPGGYVELDWEASIWIDGQTSATARLCSKQ